MTREQELEECLKEVVAVLESNQFTNVFSLMHIHGMEYSGPYINMKRIKNLLGIPLNGYEYGGMGKIETKKEDRSFDAPSTQK